MTVNAKGKSGTAVAAASLARSFIPNGTKTRVSDYAETVSEIRQRLNSAVPRSSYHPATDVTVKIDSFERPICEQRLRKWTN